MGVGGVFLWVTTKANKRMSMIEEQLPDAIELMVRSLRVGHPFASAIQIVSREIADPLASGRISFQNGRIGINGSVLFALNADRLQPEGRALLESLVEPLQTYLAQHDELLMVSGFTDDLPIQQGNPRYADNWGLSAQRALTVTRTLIDQGLPEARIFAAAFGDNQPVTANVDDAARAKNRRVEITTVPRADATAGEPEQTGQRDE